jgi:hypothetical protein
METTGNAVIQMVEAARQAVDAKTRTVEIQGVPYALERKGYGADALRELIPQNDPQASTLGAGSLTAVLDYLKENRDGLDLSRITVHVVAADRVEILGPLRDKRDRETFLRSTPTLSDRLSDFEGRYHGQEDFVLKVQTLFADTPDRAELLKLAGNLTDEAVRIAVDDGVTQQVTTKTGGAKVGISNVKNPVDLVQLRSFPEIDLNPVPFVVRVKGQPSQVALFDASGGRWRIDAIRKIYAYLTTDKSAKGRTWGIVA